MILIDSIIDILAGGGVVASPTDTVYGLLADATNEQAVEKIFIIKDRKDNKLPIFIKDIEMAKILADISPAQEAFLERVWPGKVSVVLKLKPDHPLAKNTSATDQTVALRVPNYPLINRLLEEYSKPLTGTSANKSGKPACLDVVSLRQQLADSMPDYIIDAGALPESLPSTIVDLTQDKPVIIRHGAEDKKVMEQIRNLLHEEN